MNVAWDAMGARCLVEVDVCGAPSQGAARAVALSVACSADVCEALSAGSPDWAAIAHAARYAGRGAPLRLLPMPP